MIFRDNYPDEHWTTILFTKHPELFLPLIEARIKDAPHEVYNLSRIFEDLSVPGNGRVLDLYCGIGRHAIRLAKRGYVVVGYDPSNFYVERAIQWMKQESLDITKLRFYQGDPYRISESLLTKGETNFDAIILLDNSFGYRDEIHDIQVLRNLIETTSKNCVLVIQVENRDWRLKNFQSNFVEKFDKIELHHTWKFNFERSMSEGTFKFYEKEPASYIMPKLLLDLSLRLRLYSLHELKKIAEVAGWKFIKSFGDMNMIEPVSSNTPDIVMICSK